MKCPNCNFVFSLEYPKYQPAFSQKWETENIKCPVCTADVNPFPSGVFRGSPQEPKIRVP